MKTKFILPHGMQIEFSNLLGQKRLDVVDINGFIDDIAAKTEKAINEIRAMSNFIGRIGQNKWCCERTLF